ncbi:hypothetical protein [Draconibacterium orientale]|nr:hypothetical protein [Draconibacterium orientale]
MAAYACESGNQDSGKLSQHYERTLENTLEISQHYERTLENTVELS